MSRPVEPPGAAPKGPAQPCGALSVLSGLSSERFLARCACGTLHLVWDNATIRLHERALPLVARALAGASRQGGITVRCEPFGDVQVWLLAGGLRLSSDDFHAFCTLVKSSEEALGPVLLAGGSPVAPRCQALN